MVLFQGHQHITLRDLMPCQRKFASNVSKACLLPIYHYWYKWTDRKPKANCIQWIQDVTRLTWNIPKMAGVCWFPIPKNHIWVSVFALARHLALALAIQQFEEFTNLPFLYRWRWRRLRHFIRLKPIGFNWNMSWKLNGLDIFLLKSASTCHVLVLANQSEKRKKK